MVVITIPLQEYNYSVNDFGEPVVDTDHRAVGKLLTRLLLLEPGTFQSRPEMGVGLVSKYRYTLDDQLYTLRDDFARQIAKYLPQLQGVEVSVELNATICTITAKIDRDVYAFFYDTANDSLQTVFKELEDL